MARSRSGTALTHQRLVLDSGALIAWSRGEKRARGLIARALQLRTRIVVPAVVVAETFRGTPRDAPIHRVLKAVSSIAATTVAEARLAGTLLGAAGSSSTIDALVVAHALLGGGGRILTSDPTDLEHLSAHLPSVVIERV